MGQKPKIYYLQWNPSLYLSKTYWLSNGSDLLYRRLIDAWWINKGLPSDKVKLARHARYSIDEFNQFWPEISDFFIIKGEKLRHKKLEELLEKCYIKSIVRSQAGQLGGRPKKQKESNCLSKGKQNESKQKAILELDIDIDIDKDITKKTKKTKSYGHPQANDPKGLGSNDPKVKSRRKPNGSGLERFQDFWDVWPRRVKRQESEKVWKSRKLDNQADAIIAAIPIYIEFLENQKRNGFNQDVAHPSGWLRNSRWKDELIVEKEIDYDEQWLNNFLKDPIESNNGDLETAKRAARELNSMCADTVMRIVGHELDETLNSWNEETKQWINSENIQSAGKSK